MIKAFNQIFYMKNKIILVLSIINFSILSNCFSQQSKIKLVPFLMSNGTYGIVQYGTKSLINSDTYDEIEPLKYGFLKVRKADSWGVLNNYGKLIIPINNKIVTDFFDSLILIAKTCNDYGYLMNYDKNHTCNMMFSMLTLDGKLLRDSILPFPPFSTRRIFIDNSGYNKFGKNNLFKKLEFLDQTNYYSNFLFSGLDENNLACYCLFNSSNDEIIDALVNKNGDILFKYDKIDPVGEGLFITRKSENEFRELLGCVDSSNKIIVPFKYEEIGEFKNGLCRVVLNGSTGFINRKGEVVIPFSKERIYLSPKFNDGLLPVFSKDSLNQFKDKIKFIDTKGGTVFALNSSSSIKFDNFHDGILIYTNNKGTNCLDLRGNILFTSNNFDFVTPFLKGYSKIKGSSNNYTYGLIDKKGKKILPIKYDIIYRYLGDFVYEGLESHHTSSNLSFRDPFEQLMLRIDNSYTKSISYYSYVVKEEDYNQYIDVDSCLFVHQDLIKVQLNGEDFYVDVNGFEYKYD